MTNIPEISLPPLNSRELTTLLTTLPSARTHELHDSSTQTKAHQTIRRMWGVDDSLSFARKRLEDTGYLIMHNMPFEPDGKLFVALFAGIGTIVEQYRPETLLVKDVVCNDGTAAVVTLPHTDSTGWPVPNDVTILECVRSDAERGGETRLISAKNALKFITDKHGIESARLLSSAVPFQLDQVLGGDRIIWSPIIEKDDTSKYKVRFLLHDIVTCATRNHIELEKELVKSMKNLEMIDSDGAPIDETLLNPGDVVLLNNREALHWRSPVKENSQRLLRRIKLNLHNP